MLHLARPIRSELLSRAALALLLVLAGQPLAAANEELAFIGVKIDDETAAADDKLLKYLAESEGLRFREGERQRSYGDVIDALRGVAGAGGALEPETRERFVARATPYVLVAAQLLGARLEVLATYTNGSGKTTYRSSFVVNRERFAPYGEPTQANLLRYLEDAERPVRFVYHDRFSTSSFFLPSLFFRRNAVFSTEETVGQGQNRIRSTRLPAAAAAEAEGSKDKPGSTDLVRAVASGEYDLAAVWDGTRRKFEPGGSLHEELGGQVAFIELDVDLPNDLLVAPSTLDPAVLSRIKRALGNMGDREIEVGDFASWKGLNDPLGRTACTALATLRMDAEEQLSSPAVVRIDTEPGTEELVGAVANAVRRMGHEYKLYDEAFHLKHDVVWRLRKLHDDQVVTAIELISRIEHSELEDQAIPISFDSPGSLTDRIVDVARKRLHRIAYVWPYLEETPTVIHDFDFVPEAEVRVRPIRRGDLRRNEYKLFEEEREQAIPFAAEDDFRLLLDAREFQRKVQGKREFDPLSNVVYRVVLPRPEVDPTLFRALTAGLVGLFVLAALGLGWDLTAGLRATRPKREPARKLRDGLARAT